MAKYRKRLIEIEAIQFTGYNNEECLEFCPGVRDPECLRPNLAIPLISGESICMMGDYILKEEQGNFSVWMSDQFESMYELVE